jgi:hypothetical protein
MKPFLLLLLPLLPVLLLPRKPALQQYLQRVYLCVDYSVCWQAARACGCLLYLPVVLVVMTVYLQVHVVL